MMNCFKLGKTTALGAIVALLFLVGQSNAQQNSLVFPWQSQGGTTQSSYTYQPPPTVNVENSRAFYPRSAEADKVHIDVRIPAGAKILFEGSKTTQSGEFRQFVSPSLAAGQYTYHVQATWTENGQEVNQSRAFNVRPGDLIQMIFTRDDVKVRTEN